VQSKITYMREKIIKDSMNAQKEERLKDSLEIDLK